jgi:hypothetical protein
MRMLTHWNLVIEDVELSKCIPPHNHFLILQVRFFSIILIAHWSHMKVFYYCLVLLCFWMVKNDQN